jgi:hypothetical protein
VVDPNGVITAFGLAEASSDERLIGEALVAYLLADKGFTGVHWERRWLEEEYGALVAATPYNDSRRAWLKAARRWASFARQAPDHRRGHRPAEGHLRSGAPPRQDVGRAVEAFGRQGRSLHHLRTNDQRFSRPTAASPGGPVDLVRCTSLV